MSRRPKFDHEELALKAAFLRGRLKLSQAEIAARLAVSQPVVSKCLKIARRLNYLEVREDFTPPRGHDIAQLESLSRYASVIARLKSLSTSGAPLRDVRILGSPGVGRLREEIAARQRALAQAVAGFLARHLRASTLVGVAWGSTLAHVIEELVPFGHRSSLGPSKTTFIPVTTEPMQRAGSRFTASVLAQRLHEIFSGKTTDDEDAADDQLILTGIPAFVPYDATHLIQGAKKLSKRQQEQLGEIFREYLRQNSVAYAKIFGEPGALIGEVQMLVTGAGPSERVMGFCHDNLLANGHLNREELYRLVVGDIGGVLLPRPGLDARGEAKVARLRRMFTGITLDQLKGIAERAATKGTPGVVLVTLGRDRAEIVYEALVHGLVNELVIDPELAQCLEDQFTARLKSERAPHAQTGASSKGSLKSRRVPAS